MYKLKGLQTCTSDIIIVDMVFGSYFQRKKLDENTNNWHQNSKIFCCGFWKGYLPIGDFFCYRQHVYKSKSN